MSIGRSILKAKNIIHLLKGRVVPIPVEVSGVVIFGFGRSGSTLFAQMLKSPDLIDLGEPLRSRKNLKHPIFFSNSVERQILGEYALACESESGFIAHVKPYHLSYWGVSEELFLKKAQSMGWMVIGLRRSFCERWYSEMRARARGSWVGDEGQRQEHWTHFLDLDEFEIEAERDVDFERFLEEMLAKGLIKCSVHYEVDLESTPKQRALCAKLQSIGLYATLEALPEKHKGRGSFDSKGRTFVKMEEIYSRVRQVRAH